jgi:branched-subunit amino acid aminotransferase/4-amino-4-deoxychorismate lyase
MIDAAEARIHVDGERVSAEAEHLLRLSAFGHFTAMQVRGGGVRGLALHLARLDAANRELFGVEMPGRRVLELVRDALAGDADASVRVYVLAAVGEEGATTVVTVRQPADMPPAAQALMSVPYTRTLPHIKQVGGSFARSYYGRLAERKGFDDALLTAPGGAIAEAAVCNVAFVRGGEIVWPDAPALAGITLQLVAPRLAEAGIASRRSRVRIADLGSFDSALVMNARGIAPLGRIDDHVFAHDAAFVERIDALYRAIPVDLLA